MEGHILSDPIYLWNVYVCLLNAQNGKLIRGYRGLEGGAQKWDRTAKQVSFGAINILWDQILGIVAHHCGHTKCHQISHFKMVHLKKKLIYLAARGLSCSMCDPVPWPEIEPRTSAEGAQSLSHWTTREVPHCKKVLFMLCEFYLHFLKKKLFCAW